MASVNPLAIREKISDLHNQAQAIVELAESEDRELSAEDRTQFDALMSEIGDDSDSPTGLYADLRRTEKLEALKLALARKEKQPEPGAAKEETYNIRALGWKNTGPLKAFKGPRAEENAYKAGMWLKAIFLQDSDAKQWCRDRGVGFQGAQTEGTNSAGGYTVPDPLSDAVIEARSVIGLARRVCDIFPMSSDTLSIPKLTAGQTVQYPAEAASITASDTTWGTISCAAVKRAVLTKVSNELLADSVVNIADRVASRAGYELGLREDLEFLQGDDSSSYGGVNGLVNVIGAAGTVTMSSGNTTYEDVTLANLNALAGKLPDKYHTGASWICSRAFFAEAIQRLLYAAGGNTVGNIADGSGAQLFGYGINFSDQMPSEAVSTFGIFFGNFEAAAVLADRTGIEVASSEHYAFNEDVLTLKLTSRYDIQVHEPGDGSDAGAFVGLKTAAS